MRNEDSKKNVVDAIRTISISSLNLLISDYPGLEEILKNSKSLNPADDWYYFMTSAGAGLVLMSTEDYKGEHLDVINRLAEMDSTYPIAIDDLRSFVKRFEVSDEDFPAIIGGWVLWNLKHEKPTEEEFTKLAPIIGRILFSVIADWRRGNA
jgi:hypothetical protein